MTPPHSETMSDVMQTLEQQMTSKPNDTRATSTCVGHARARFRRPRRQRRGVLLLIVLSLLVLFLMIGLSFMVSARQFNDFARAAARTEATGMGGHQLADNVMYQLVRGTNNPYSSLQGHSLLEDLYGRDYLMGTASAINDDNTSQQVQRITFDVTAANLGEATSSTNPAIVAQVNQTKKDDYYAGCVLTFVSGTAKGKSTRVVSYKPTNQSILIKGVQPVPSSGSQFIINGRPFNGTGAGYNYATGQLNVEQLSESSLPVPVALMPHYRTYQHNAFLLPFFQGDTAYNLGGMDESYDSVDYQNMFLAKPADRLRYATASALLAGGASVGNVDLQNLVNFYGTSGGAIPSFHRPYLLQHIKLHRSSDFADSQVQRAIMMRPLGGPTGDHPAFTGSNPNFDPIMGPWDVDNDGDGIPESIWIDAGLSPVSAPDGRLYKPLVAVHVVDMDGRFNINAIDGLERTKAAASSYSTRSALERTIETNQEIRLDLPIEKSDLGMGYGPADITGLQESVIRSRYQGNVYDGSGNLVETKPATGATAPVPWDEYSGVARAKEDDDGANPNELRQLMKLPTGALFMRTSTLLSGYSSPLDLHARGLPYLDPQGNMVWSGSALGAKEGIDDPYEANLLQRTPFDNHYDLKDLLSLLAVNPADYRIVSTQKTLKTNSQEIMVARGLVAANSGVSYTTRSFSIPALPAVGVGRNRGADGNGDGLPRTLREMFAAKLIRGGVNPAQAYTFVETWDMMAPELARGEKIDINRVLFPNRFDVTVPATDIAHPAQQRKLLIAKERFARHLFNLMMLLCDESQSGVPGLAPAAAREAHVRRIAQWAINVVDFGDADSVMTRFRYDANPFNNEPIRFRADGEPHPASRNSVDFREIWGMEHPEVLLTETLALHDRRVQNTDEDPSGDTYPDEPHFDSVTMPEGSLFIELLCMRGQDPTTGSVTWGNSSAKGAEDLYPALPNGSPSGVLDLDAHLPGSAKPVWRLAISEIHPSGFLTPREYFEGQAGAVPDPIASNRLRSFEPKQSYASLPVSRDKPSPYWSLPNEPLESLNLELERFIWFSNSAPPAAGAGVGQEERPENTYVYNPEGSMTPVMRDVRPGDYVLVGPRLTTHIGLDDNNLDELGQTIDLQLAPKGAGGRALQRLENLGRVVPVVARTTGSHRVGCSVSEPLDNSNYYPDLPARTNANRAEKYDPPIDEPLDNSVGPLKDLDHDTTTHEDFRTVFLQRLANPRLPWNNNPDDLQYNPYRTIDWMPIDLSVFNSLNLNEDDPDDPVGPKVFDLSQLNSDGVRFESLERTGYPDRSRGFAPNVQALFDAGFGLFDVWSAWTSEPLRNVSPTADGPVHHVDDTTLVHSLGWLNRSFADFLPNRSGVVNSGFGYYRPSADPYAESPLYEVTVNTVPLHYTFPSLVWHNRPYANPYELMLVPATSSSRLSADYSTSLVQGSPVNDPVAVREYRGAFGHLLNFFHSSPGVKGEADNAGNFHRIFDFVHVPSRFQGTETWLTRTKIPATHPLYIDANDPIEREITKPTISESREPGKVNLNSFRPELASLDMNTVRQIAERLGFNSLIDDADEPLDPWLAFQTSLAGNEPLVRDLPVDQGGLGTGLFGRYPNGNHPAEYPNPFRSSTGADLKPTPLVASARMPLALDATLLRSLPVTSGLEVPALALPETHVPATLRTPESLLAESIQNPKTNAYFRYKDLAKLGSSVTSQSNVYAVWITVGYFEILPNMNANYTAVDGIDANHADGYQLGIELGSDVGRVTRHRSFYIIDRSIPVAFQPGANHNVDDAVLIRRRLE